jgi:hypothetical protein
MEVLLLCGAAAGVAAKVVEADVVAAGFAEAEEVEVFEEADDGDEAVGAANIYPFTGIALAKPAEAIVVVANT